MTHDPFEPSREPARTIYRAFQQEAAMRKGRSLQEWILAERQAVWEAAKTYAREHGLEAPSLKQIEAAERYAMGSVDYGAKWAWAVERHMLPPRGTTTARTAPTA